MKHFAIFLSAISVLLLSGCQEKIEKGKKEAWNRTVDTVAGKYSLTLPTMKLILPHIMLVSPERIHTIKAEISE